MATSQQKLTDINSQRAEPWKDKSWLYDQYWRDGRSQTDIADQFGLCSKTIHYWLRKHGIPTRGAAGADNPNAYALRRMPRKYLAGLYWGQTLSSGDIAEMWDVYPRTVIQIMDDHNPPIDRHKDYMKERNPNANLHPTIKTVANTNDSNCGYRIWYVGPNENGHNRYIREHRANAIAEWGLDTIKRRHVHHANGIKWLNVPVFETDIPELEQQNLVPIDPVTHSKIT